MKRTLAALGTLAVLASAATTIATADTPTPTIYRAQLNAVCRSYTPRFKKYEAQIAAAQKAGNNHALGYVLGELLATALLQDSQLERAPVPPALESRLTPIIARLRQADLHIRLFLGASGRADAQTMGAEWTKLGKIGAPLNRMFDAAGLRDCGSNQP
ncbi:MAG TPA: hypothetical protein VH108_08195 [Gaiellaceae bacterium]|nr:hypothetical protein [Gaiellaceae bacterium]